MWDVRDQRDWRGYGLIRNGTANIVGDMFECMDQCQVLAGVPGWQRGACVRLSSLPQRLPECRVMFFERNSKECWLDSRFSDKPGGGPCPDSLRPPQTVTTANITNSRLGSATGRSSAPVAGP
jgi:hypothetical protein